LSKLKLNWNPVILTKFLVGVTCILTLINVIIQFAIYSFGLNDEWFLLFNMDKEVNIPTLFSCCLFLLGSFLIKLIEGKSNKKKIYIIQKWRVLKWIFLFLAFDEGFQIHEAFIIPSFKPLMPPALTVIWVIPYGIFAICCFLYFLPLIMNLPSRIRNLILISGTTYVSGALGLEIMGSFLVRTGDIRLHGISYGLISTLEETLELAGLILFIYALLSYIFNHQKQKIKLNLRLASIKSNAGAKQLY